MEFNSVYIISHTLGIGTMPKYEDGRKALEIVYFDGKRAWALSYGDHSTPIPKYPCRFPRALSYDMNSFDIVNVENHLD